MFGVVYMTLHKGADLTDFWAFKLRLRMYDVP